MLKEILKKSIFRKRNKKILEKDLLTKKYILFNLTTTNYFKKEEIKLNERYSKILIESENKKKIKIPPSLKKNQEKIFNKIKNKFILYKNILEKKENQNFEILEKKNLREIKSNIFSFRENFLQFFKLYNESLENLVEGQREVLSNDKFVIDGESVKEKEEKLELFFNKFKSDSLNQIKKKIKK